MSGSAAPSQRPLRELRHAVPGFAVDLVPREVFVQQQPIRFSGQMPPSTMPTTRFSPLTWLPPAICDHRPPDAPAFNMPTARFEQMLGTLEELIASKAELPVVGLLDLLLETLVFPAQSLALPLRVLSALAPVGGDGILIHGRRHESIMRKLGGRGNVPCAITGMVGTRVCL